MSGVLLQVMELETLADTFNKMAQDLNQSFEHIDQQRQSFARFFPSEFFHFLEKSDIQEIELGNYVSQDMSILFSDIRSFTNLSEQMTPQENFEFVNAYLGQVSPEIRRYQGFVVKFIGDGLMAVFPTGADAAVAAGIAQFQQLASFNQNNQNNQYPGISHLAPIQIGMGIHTGQVMLGMLGETHRLQGDAISAQVNFAARLEGLTKYFGALLLISQTTYDHLQDPQRYQIRFLDNVRVKGTQRPMGIYEVLDAWLDESYRTLRWEQSGYLTEIIERFTQGDFEGALSLLNPLRIADPQNLTWSLYSQEIKRCQAHGEPWDGVITFDRK